MFKKILFPIDFSEVAEKALEFVKKLKKSGAEEVIVLHVIEDKYMYFLDELSIMALDRFEKDMKQDVMKKISPFANTLYDAGYKVKVMTTRGAPAREILRAEQTENVSITVLGSHGMNYLKEMLHSSVSETIMRRSRQPVVVVKRYSQI
jgi:nucleotide-binding universal stress UspA family protein